MRSGFYKFAWEWLTNLWVWSIIVLGGDIVNFTGASGAIPRGDYKRLNSHAKLFYEEVRNRTGDIEEIAKNSKFSEEDIRKIKEHMFFNEYDLGRKVPSKFDPDYDQAVSWQRLTEGKNVQEMDIILLNHELMEYDLMNNRGFSYHDAHKIAELSYNYSEHVKALNRKEGLV